ncbi:MAG: PEGA domain-containing protein [Calditrichaeota bacterium]|nr:MAG: PEGA domain-containing protein [Calditrichota bacterium]
MPLTPEEEKRLREKIRKELEERESRIRESKEQEEKIRQQQLEERIRQKIKEEEEERFYQERGYVKYINHRGEVEWITPEEAKKRSGRRRSRKTSSRQRKRTQRRIFQIVLNLVLVFAAGMIFMFLLRYNPIKKPKVYGAIQVITNVPGAQIFLNGAEKNLFTPDTIPHLATGKNYFISVYKDGYSCWPPMQQVTVERNRVVTVNFELKHSAYFATLELQSNVTDYQLFVDGVPFQHDGNQIQIPSGYHVIAAVKSGYLASPAFHRVLLERDEHQVISFNFKPVKDLGYIRVTNNRSTSYVYLNNRLTGIKANKGFIPVEPGIYEVRVRENGFQPLPEVEILTINPNERRTLSFHMTPVSAVDTLQILSNPPGASISIDGYWQPLVTPAPEILLSRGDHFINLMVGETIYRETDLLVDASHFEKKRLEIDF